MQMEVVDANENQNQQETAIKGKESQGDCQNNQRVEGMDMEEQNIDEQVQLKNNDVEKPKKKRQGVIGGLDSSQIVEGKRQRKPLKAITEQPPSPKKIIEKKKPIKYQYSSEIEKIQEKIAQWDNLKSELQLLGFPSIILDDEKINDLLKEQEKRDEAAKNYHLKILIGLIGESLCCTNRAQVSQQIQTKLKDYAEKNSINIDWTQEYWDEQIKSFVEIKYEYQQGLVQEQEFFDFNKLFQLTQNEFPLYVTEKKFGFTLISVKSKHQINELKKVCDLNELKNIRKIREYIWDLYSKLDQLKQKKKAIDSIKKVEDEAGVKEQYENINSDILTLKNQPIKFEPKTEIKIKQPPQPKQKQKSQNQESIIKLEKQELEDIQGENQTNQEGTTDSKEKKVKDSKSNKKKEKEEEKKVCTLDRYSFKKVDIASLPAPASIVEQNSIINDTNEISQFSEPPPQPLAQPSEQQPQNGVSTQNQAQPTKNIKHFFQPKRQEIQKIDGFQPKTLADDRLQQFENLIDQLANNKKPEYQLQNLNCSTETEAKIVQQQVRMRKIYLFIFDSIKEYNGYQFVQLSQVIRPRKPFQLDDQINYNEDSEAEVEELAAENLSDTDNSDEESSDEVEQKDSFLVEDDHLSKDEVDDPEELLNNEVVANQAQNQNGVVFIKFLQSEPEYFTNFKAVYVTQYFQVQQQKEQPKIQGQTTLLQNQQNNQIQLKPINLQQQPIIPVAKMTSSSKKQIKQQKPKTQKTQLKPQQKQTTLTNESSQIVQEQSATQAEQKSLIQNPQKQQSQDIVDTNQQQPEPIQQGEQQQEDNK